MSDQMFPAVCVDGVTRRFGAVGHLGPGNVLARRAPASVAVLPAEGSP